MRLREAMIYALRFDARLAKKDRSGTLKIEGSKFVSDAFRAKYGGPKEVCLDAKDCLSEDWYLMKNGKEFVPDA